MAKQTWMKIDGEWVKATSAWIKEDGKWKKDVMPKGVVEGDWREFMQYATFNFIYDVMYYSDLIKFNSEGNQIDWQKRLHPDVVTGYSATPADISYAADGSIYLALMTDTPSLIKLTNKGDVIWTVYEPQAVYAVATDKDGNVMLGMRNANPSVRKFDSGGTELWEFRKPTHYANSLAVDKDGYIYCGSHTTRFYKLTPEGEEVWSVQINADINSYIRSIEVDTDFNVYVVFDDSYSNRIRKYTKDGVYTGTVVNHSNLINKISLDTNNDIYIPQYKGELRKRAGGTLSNVWTKTPTTNTVEVAVHKDGSVYYSTQSGDVYKYDLDGNLIWSETSLVAGSVSHKTAAYPSHGAHPNMW